MKSILKNHLFSAVIISLSALAVVATSCADSPDKKMHEFAEKFARFANLNQRDSIKAYYPDYNLSDSIFSNIISADIKITPTLPDGYWKVEYGEGRSLEANLSPDGHISVKESHGLFAYPEKILKLAQEKGIWHAHENDVEQAKKIVLMMEERKKFSTADLSFFSLHAPVKSMTITYPDSVRNLFDNLWGWASTYHFDEKGNFIDVNSVKLDASHQLTGVRRNSDNSIAALIFNPTDTWDGEALYFWEEGKLVGAESHYGSYQAMFTFHPDGFLDRMSYRYGNTEGINGADVVLSDYVTDDMGNWIKCNWTMQTVTPVPYYSAITGALVGYKDSVIDTKTGTLSRNIEYY